MSETAKRNAPGLIDKYRREETKGLPMYIVFHNKDGKQGFAINGHPQCKYKSFTTNKHGSVEECKNAACEFLANLIATGEMYEHVKKADAALPMGLTKFRTGYKVRRKIGGILRHLKLMSYPMMLRFNAL